MCLYNFQGRALSGLKCYLYPEHWFKLVKNKNIRQVNFKLNLNTYVLQVIIIKTHTNNECIFYPPPTPFFKSSLPNLSTLYYMYFNNTYIHRHNTVHMYLCLPFKFHFFSVHMIINSFIVKHLVLKN